MTQPTEPTQQPMEHRGLSEAASNEAGRLYEALLQAQANYANFLSYLAKDMNCLSSSGWRFDAAKARFSRPLAPHTQINESLQGAEND